VHARRRPLRRLALGAATLALLTSLTTAPGAQGDHVTASVSATAELGKAVKFCEDEGDFCARGRRVKISWQSSCGPAAPPDSYLSVDVSVVGIRPDGTRFTAATAASSSAPNGSEVLDIGPGIRFVGEVSIECRATTIDPGGDLVDHVSTATASSAELYLQPQVKAAVRVFPLEFSCRSLPITRISRVLKRREKALLTWQLSYYEESVLAPGVPEARQITLFARGAGLRLKRPPNRTMRRRYRVIGLPVRPSRAGNLRIWATVNGQRTNTLPVEVLPC
jgi:hypothetical protein